jgi:putative addiction module killer protein
LTPVILSPELSFLDKLYFINYDMNVLEIIQSTTFSIWLGGLKDRQARMRIHARLDRLALGNLGDVYPVGSGLSELRIHYGLGYRLYCMLRGLSVVVMLCGGDKSTQPRDIEQAKIIAKDWRD